MRVFVVVSSECWGSVTKWLCLVVVVLHRFWCHYTGKVASRLGDSDDEYSGIIDLNLLPDRIFIFFYFKENCNLNTKLLAKGFSPWLMYISLQHFKTNNNKGIISQL